MLHYFKQKTDDGINHLIRSSLFQYVSILNSVTQRHTDVGARRIRLSINHMTWSAEDPPQTTLHNCVDRNGDRGHNIIKVAAQVEVM